MNLKNSNLKEVYKKDFLEALKTLEYSWSKLKDQAAPVSNERADSSNLEVLESWEAFTSRFARTTDIFLSKYIRLLVIEVDPGFRGEIRDYIDKAEKLNFISDGDTWMKIRELRNKISHEYSREDLNKTFQQVVTFTPFVLADLERHRN